MSDKDTYQEDFIKKGWQDMSAILDKEMPVEKKRRGLLWLWFPTIILLGIGAIGVVTLWSQTPAIETVEGIRSTIESSSPVQESMDEVSPIIKQSTASDSKVLLPNNPKIPTGFNKNDVTQHANHSKQPPVQNTIITTGNHPPKTITPRSTPQKASTPAGQNSNPIFETPYAPTLPNTLEQPQETLLLEPIALMETSLESTPMETITGLDDVAELEQINSPTISKWEKTLELGYSIQNQHEMGLKGGFLATRKINGYWGIQTGLEYQLHFVKYSQSETASLANNAGLELDDMQIGNPVVVDMNFSSTRSNEHTLKTPLLADYQINRKWNANAGLVGSYRFYTGKGLLNSASSDTFSSGIIANTVPLEFNPSWDIMGTVGISYAINRNWSFNVRYDHGFRQRKVNDAPLKGYDSRNRHLGISALLSF